MIQDGDTKCKGRVDVHVFSLLGTAQRRKRCRCNKRKPKPAGAATGIASSTLWCGQQWQLDAPGIIDTARPYLCQVQLTGCNTLNCSKCTTCGVMQGVMSGVGQAAQLSCCEMIGGFLVEPAQRNSCKACYGTQQHGDGSLQCCLQNPETWRHHNTKDLTRRAHRP